MNIESFKIVFIVIAVLVGLIFIFTLALMFSPKLKAKFIGLGVKTAKYVQEDNEDTLKELSKKSGEMVGTAAKAIKEGLAIETKKCKYCDAEIPADSDFCNKCGKEQ